MPQVNEIKDGWKKGGNEVQPRLKGYLLIFIGSEVSETFKEIPFLSKT